MIEVRVKIKKGDIEVEVQGNEKFVNTKINELEKKYFTIGGTWKVAEVSKADSHEKQPKSLASLIRDKGPKSMSEETLIAAYFLDKKGISKFTVRDISDILKEARRKRPANLNDTINLNISKGFFISAGDKDKLRSWVITSEGSEYVEKMTKE